MLPGMISALLAVAAVAQQPSLPPPGPPPPPPVIVGAAMPSASAPRLALIEYEGTEVRCRGEDVRPSFAPRPLPTSAYLREGRSPPVFQIAFRIAPDGRPLGISRPNRIGDERQEFYVDPDDLAPTLAAWRFQAGVERPGCVATFTPRAVSVEDAPAGMLHRYIALPHVGGVAWEVATKRLRDESPGCFGSGPPRPVLQGYPDFDVIPQPPGTFSYSMVGFDIDARGVPAKVRILSSDGNVAFDRAAMAAIAKSRFAGGARTGCHYPYHRRQAEPVEAPPPPKRGAFVTMDARCDPKEPWAKTPVLVFPEAFRRRPFEGWAMVRYDVAPWGATGRIEVLASEPAAAFGEQVRQVIAAATRAPSAAGATGCVDRVLFKLPREGDAPKPEGSPALAE